MWDNKIISKTRLYEPLFSWVKKLVGNYSSWPSPLDYNTWSESCPVSFVTQEYHRTDVFEMQYEPRIFLHKQVLTRAKSWHDFFNALVWMSMPKTKLSINRLHYSRQRERGASIPRTRLENKLTHFDECGAIILSEDLKLLEMIKKHSWHELFWQNRDKLHKLKLLIVGHATYESLVNPYVGLTTKTILVHDEGGRASICKIDNFLADNLERLLTESPNFAPFPILGMPNCYSQNNREDFYNNFNYFRPNNSNRDYKVEVFS